MTRKIHLWLEEHEQRDTRIEVPALLEGVRGKKHLFCIGEK